MFVKCCCDVHGRRDRMPILMPVYMSMYLPRHVLIHMPIDMVMRSHKSSKMYLLQEERLDRLVVPNPHNSGDAA